jgi:hypothetical protein
MNRWRSGTVLMGMKTIRSVMLVCTLLAMVGCTSLKPLTTDPAELRSSLKRGDHVQLVTANGEDISFDVESLDDTGMQDAAGRRVAYSDIRTISRKQTAMGSTALVVLGIVAVGALAAGGAGGGSSSY